MENKDLYKIFKIEDLQELPKAVDNVLFSDEKQYVFHKLLDLFDWDLSYDWFQYIYENELAQRNHNKQDFTPNAVGILLSNLTGISCGKIYEPTAGNGSLIIANWWYRKNNIKNYNPLEHPVECWELSTRSLPILLFNLSIRGIIGEVFHGDVLTKKTKAKYVLKPNNQFSKIVRHEI